MNDLLKKVLEAHGGLSRWSEINQITAQMTIGGSFWEIKEQPHFFGEEKVEADTRRQRIRLTSSSENERVIDYDDESRRILVTGIGGKIIEESFNPRLSFAGFNRMSKLNVSQAAYFISYSIWNYLMEPFLFTFPGFEIKEIEPWEELFQTWRRLLVKFPDTISTHSPQQTFHYDDLGMLKRMDHEPMINGVPLVSLYAYSPKNFGGIVFPTVIRINQKFAGDSMGRNIAPITIDIHDIKVS